MSSIKKIRTTEGDLSIDYNSLDNRPDLTDYVKNTDYASNAKGGVFKTNSNYGTTMINGYLGGDERSFAGYNQMTNYGLIGKGTLENVIAGKGLTTKSYVDGLVGDINTALDAINGEVI